MNFPKPLLRAPLVGLVLAGVLSIPARAADDWSYVVEPYLMLPNMKGDITLGNLAPVHVDEDPSDIFSNLQIGAMFYLEARNESWALSSDLLYMDLKSGGDTSNPLVTHVTGEAEQLGWELAALRRLGPVWELGLAATYNDIKSTIKLTTAGGQQPGSSLKQDWVDPSIVARATFPLSAKWALVMRGNIGGFGVGSDLFWQLQAHAMYTLASGNTLSFGYRYISVDYDHGSGGDRFRYDVDSFGPTFRFAWRF